MKIDRSCTIGMFADLLRKSNFKYSGNFPDEKLIKKAKGLYESGHTFLAAMLIERYTSMSIKQSCRYVDIEFNNSINK